jgi:hypothetical protein
LCRPALCLQHFQCLVAEHKGCFIALQHPCRSKRPAGFVHPESRRAHDLPSGMLGKALRGLERFMITVVVTASTKHL